MSTSDYNEMKTTEPQTTGEVPIIEITPVSTTNDEYTTKTPIEYMKEEDYDPNKIYYKRCSDYIVTLALYPSSKLNISRPNIMDPLHAKLRTDKAWVLHISHIQTGEEVEEVCNTFYYSTKLVYKVGTKVETEYDPEPTNICTQGIHIFKTKEQAKNRNPRGTWTQKTNFN